MRKNKLLVILIILLLISGCSVNKEKKDTNPIDPGIWGYEYDATSVGGMLAIGTQMTKSDQGIYFRMIIPTNNYGDTDVLGYYDFESEKVSIVDSSGSASCTVSNPVRCTSFTAEGKDFLKYYNEHLYYKIQKRNEKTGIFEEYLIQMDLDGTNRQEILRLDVDGVSVGSYAFSIIFHKGFIYHTYGDGIIYQTDMSTWESEEFLKFAGSDGPSLDFAKDDSLYFNFAALSTDDGRYSDVVLTANITDKTFDVLYENLAVFGFNDKYAIYFDYDNMMMSYKNFENNLDSVLKAGSGSVVVRENGFILPDTNAEESGNSLWLFNQEGDLIDTVKKSDHEGRMSSWTQISTEDAFYTYIYQDDKQLFVCYKVSEDGFGEMEVLYEWGA